jgi:hypothetical protein
MGNDATALQAGKELDTANFRTASTGHTATIPSPAQFGVAASAMPADTQVRSSRHNGGGQKIQLHFRRAQPSETRQLKEWIAANHYLQSCPPGFVQLYEFTDGARLIGGMLLGRPSAKAYDPDRILQLHRVFFVDDTQPFVESHGLSLMRRHVRDWLPQIRGLLSYSDPTEGHKGTIYEADMWCPLGLTDEHRGYGWKSREGRRDQKISKKMRWFRTP